MICSIWCKKCGSCMELDCVREELKASYIFETRKDELDQPVFWKVYFKNKYINPIFRTEISKTRGSEQIIG